MMTTSPMMLVALNESGGLLIYAHKQINHDQKNHGEQQIKIEKRSRSAAPSPRVRAVQVVVATHDEEAVTAV